MKLPLTSFAGKMKVACFISGNGTNATKIIEYQNQFPKCNYEVVLIFSDNENSNANEIGNVFKIPIIICDIKNFYLQKKLNKNDLSKRNLFDENTINLISSFHIDIIVLCGYMSIVSKILIKKYLIINVHPADLRIEENGKRKFVGANAIQKSIQSGEKFLHSTTHIVNHIVDGGKILIVSEAIKVEKNLSIKEHQEKLKQTCDWKIYPKTLELIANQKFLKDENNNLYFLNKKIQTGILYEEIKN